MSAPRSALIVGATGLVGSHLLGLLLANPEYGTVTALVRRSLGRNHDKLVERIVDFDRLPESSGDWQADDVFSCLGTTIAAAGSQERFRRVDHDYTVEVARLARERGATRLALVSSIGAGERASSFYLRVKGETERDVSGLGYVSVELFRPSLLVGDRAERRRGEAVAVAASGAFSWAMIGGLRAYRPIEADRVAAAMVQAVLRAAPGVRVRSYKEIIDLSS
jgi:uncharacterized protein YbjT (DUF2867 family)